MRSNLPVILVFFGVLQISFGYLLVPGIARAPSLSVTRSRPCSSLQFPSCKSKIIVRSRGFTNARVATYDSSHFTLFATPATSMPVATTQGNATSTVIEDSSESGLTSWLPIAPNSFGDKSSLLPWQRFLVNVWEFSRPHTVVGTILSITTVFMFAVPQQQFFTSETFAALVNALIPSLLINLYITGLNQLTDAPIDAINKPYLPIASGELSMRTGIAIVTSSLLTGLYWARNSEWPLQLALVSSALLGTVYSLYPFRLKRYPIFAALCIMLVRGAIVNFGYFFQAKIAILANSVPDLLTGLADYPEIIPIGIFFSVFGFVIALMKDIPDIEGDAANNIQSFSVRFGAKNMFRIAWGTLYYLMAGATLYAARLAFIAPSLGKALAVFGLLTHSLAIQSEALKVSAVPQMTSELIFKYYLFIWEVFYRCYLVLPLMQSN